MVSLAGSEDSIADAPSSLVGRRSLLEMASPLRTIPAQEAKAFGFESGPPPVLASSNKVRVGVVGYGYWGPQIVRNFHTLESSEVAAVCDVNTGSLHRVQAAYPGIEVTKDYKQLLRYGRIEAVAIVTPVRTHYELAKMALENGKHVFV